MVFVCGDLAFSDRSSLPGLGTYTAARLTQALLPLTLSYLVLGLLLVVIPAAANGFAVRAATLRRARARSAMLASCAVYVGVVAALGYAWAQAMPFMIRSLWSFAGQTPDTGAIQPIQGSAGALGGIMAVAAIGRCVLAGVGTGFSAWPSPVAGAARPAGGRGQVLPTLARVPLRALLLTLLLGGVIANVGQGAVIFALLCVVFVARLIIIPLIPRYPEAVSRVPVLVRVGLCALIGYWLGGAIVQPAVDNSEASFTPLLVAILLSLGAAALLLPAVRGQRGTGLTRPGTTTGFSGSDGGGPRPPHGAPEPATLPQPQARPPRRPAPGERALAGAARSARAALLTLADVAGLIAADAAPAYADNCGDPSDCSAGVKVALIVAAIALVGLVIVILPELIGPVAEEAATGLGLSRAELEQALEYATKENKLHHIIDEVGHGLQFLVESEGGRAEAMTKIVTSLADMAGLLAADYFQVVRVINGVTLTITGRVIDGIPFISDAFDPTKFLK